jgi:hypothetical protein
MKTIFFSAILAGLMPSACMSTLGSRIAADTTYYESLSADDKLRLKHYEALPGDSMRYTLLALGKPDGISEKDGVIVLRYNMIITFVGSGTRTYSKEESMGTELTFLNEKLLRLNTTFGEPSR